MPKKAELKAKLSLDTSAFTRGIRIAEKAAASVAKGGLEMAKRGIRDMGLVSLAASAALLYGIKRAYDLGHEMQEMSEKTGIAVDQLMILNRAAKDHGIDDISTSVKKMQVNIVEAIKNGTGPAAQAFEALGLSAYDLVNKAPIEQFKAIGKAIATIQNSTVRASEAVAIFGREGSRMLSLFSNAGALDSAAKSVGKQAQILKENAERFAQVSIQMSHVGEKLEGFFVGVAEKILPAVEIATAKLDALDLAGMGEEFAGYMREAANYIVGAFENPQAFGDVVYNTLMFAFAKADNFLLDHLTDAALTFSATFLEGIDLITRALEAGVAVMADELKSDFVEQIYELSDGFTDVKDVLILGMQEAVDILLAGAEAFGKAIHQDVTDIQVARSVVKGLAENTVAGDQSQQVKDKANRFHPQIRSFEEAMGNQVETIFADLAKTTRAGIGVGNGKDYFGAEEYKKAALAAAEKLHKAGKAIVDAVMGVEKTYRRALNYQMTIFSPMNGGLQTGGLQTGGLGLGMFRLQGGPGKGTPIIRAAERRAFENSMVAQGLMDPNKREANLGPHTHYVRSGDFRRARNVALEREREAQKNQAKNIANIADNTSAMADAWGAKGAGAAGQ